MVQRLTDTLLDRHFGAGATLALVSGPSAIGKSTTASAVAPEVWCLRWSDPQERAVLQQGPEAVAEHVGLYDLERRPRQILALPELVVHSGWRRMTRTLLDRYGKRLSLVVTASVELEDSALGPLTGKGKVFHMLPLSEGELVRPNEPPTLPAEPRRLAPASVQALWEFGGFPEPFTRAERRFAARWHHLRMKQLLGEQVAIHSQARELEPFERYVAALDARPSARVSYTDLAKQAGIAVDTARRWLKLLERLHHGFAIRPYTRGVKKSLRAEPRYYPRDWSRIDDPALRAQTYLACHLDKAVTLWRETGLGRFELHYVRDKEKREVDFLVSRDGEPWVMVAVETRGAPLRPALSHFQKQLDAPHVLQVAMDAPYVEEDAFAVEGEPVKVPARTLLSQLP